MPDLQDRKQGMKAKRKGKRNEVLLNIDALLYYVHYELRALFGHRNAYTDRHLARQRINSWQFLLQAKSEPRA